MKNQYRAELERLKKILEERKANRENPFNGGKPTYQAIIESSTAISNWLPKRSPENTKKNYTALLIRFCVDSDIAPSQFLKLTPEKARDLVWAWIEKNCLEKEQTSQAVIAQAVLTSFYRFESGVRLPWAGKHRIHVTYKRAGKVERIPSVAESWLLVDSARSLRDKALISLLLSTGIRVNGATRLTLGDVKELNSKDPLPIRITDAIDLKMRRRRRQHYWTFISGEHLGILREYVRRFHKPNEPDNTPLFQTIDGNPISIARAEDIVTETAKLAGFKKTEAGNEISCHTLRKFFRQCLRRGEIPEDTAELVLGHVLKGSEESYLAIDDVDTLSAAYQRADFSRPEVSKLKSEISNLENETKASVSLTRAQLSYASEQNKAILGEIEQLKQAMRVLEIFKAKAPELFVEAVQLAAKG